MVRAHAHILEWGVPCGCVTLEAAHGHCHAPTHGGRASVRARGRRAVAKLLHPACAPTRPVNRPVAVRGTPGVLRALQACRVLGRAGWLVLGRTVYVAQVCAHSPQEKVESIADARCGTIHKVILYKL